jgi:signal transduction histidine kinase
VNIKLPIDVKQNLYLILKEAVNNIAKHSDATQVLIDLRNEGGWFEIRISDNGRGFDNVETSGCRLKDMGMGAESIKAKIRIVSENGVTIILE